MSYSLETIQTLQHLATSPILSKHSQRAYASVIGLCGDYAAVTDGFVLVATELTENLTGAVKLDLSPSEVRYPQIAQIINQPENYEALSDSYIQAIVALLSVIGTKEPKKPGIRLVLKQGLPTIRLGDPIE